MRFVKAQPNEYLVVGRKGHLVSKGTAGSAFLWPTTTFVLMPATKQEAVFQMTQESRDGVPLRFKGIVIYRIVNPVAAAASFNFTGPSGHEEINELIGHICLGELRALVSHMTMQECIEQRKTTLTEAVMSSLIRVVSGAPDEEGSSGTGWGIELDVVQVAQVFIVDQGLRTQLEAEVRNKIKQTSDLSDIQTQEEIKLAGIHSERKLQKEGLETERERIAIRRETFRLEKQAEQERIEADAPVRLVEIEKEQEKFRLEKQAEQERIEADAPVRLIEIARKKEALEQELEMRTLENQVKQLEVRRDIMLEEAKHNLRKEILPLEQVPAIADALSRSLQGSTLTVYGDADPLLSTLAPLMDLLGRALREAPSQRGQAMEPDAQQ